MGGWDLWQRITRTPATLPGPTPPLPRALFRADRAELPSTPLIVESATGAPLPAALRGHLFVVGLVGNTDTGGLPFPAGKVASMFVSDGMIVRFDFAGDGGASVRTRLARTADWYADAATARPDSPHRRQRFFNLGMIRVSPRLGMRDLLNTAFLPVSSNDPDAPPRLLVTYDGGRPWELDTASLDLVTPIGRRTEWRAGAFGSLPFPMVLTTAHPAWDARTGELFAINYGKDVATLLGALPVGRAVDGAREATARALRRLGWTRAAERVARPAETRGRALSGLRRRIPARLRDLVPEGFTDLVRWRGDGPIERWRLVTAEGRPLAVDQSMHQIAVTELHVILLDTGFKIRIGQLFGDLFPRLRTLDRLLRRRMARPLRPTAILHFIAREDLRRTPPAGSVTVARSVTLPLPAIHFLADYGVDTADGREVVTLHVPHCEATDVSEWVRPYDVSAWGGRPIDREILSINASGADINSFARYRVDVKSGEVRERRVVADDRSTWGLALVAGRGVGVAGPLPDAHDVLFYSAAGFWSEQLTRFIDDLYADWPGRVTPRAALKDLWRQGDRPSAVIAVDARTLAILDRYEAPKSHIVFTPQFVADPAGEGPRAGWLTVMAWGASRVELWIFDARDLARGPLWKLHAPALKLALTVHSAWVDRVGPRRAAYAVDVVEDLAPAVAWRGRDLQALFADEVYPHFR